MTTRRPRKTYDAELVPDNEAAVVKRLPRAKTPEARESQLVALTYDLAEEQLLKGTASSQVMTHFLKIGSTREKIELEKLKLDVKLVDAKIAEIKNAEDMKVLYAEAMDAMRGYSGQGALSPDDPIVF